LKKITAKKITVTAMLVAVSVVLARFCVIYITPSLRVNFGNIPIMLCGLLYGPIFGGLAGGIADLIGSLLLSALGWYPPLTVSAVLIGLIPGLLSFIPKKKTDIKSVGITVLASNLAASILWSTFWLSKLYGGSTTLAALFSMRIPLYLGMTVLETILITAIYKIAAKMK